MKIRRCAIPGPLVIEPAVFADDRGSFFESWNKDAFAAAGLPADFVQDNHCRSARGVLRGLHFQNPMPQGKLVRVVAGAVWDVAVDLRRSSGWFGRWVAAELDADNRRMFWVPEGFAHGYLALRSGTEILYKCTAPYAPEHEQCVAWDDPSRGIDWPMAGIAPILSAKDRAGVTLAAARAFA